MNKLKQNLINLKYSILRNIWLLGAMGFTLFMACTNLYWVKMEIVPPPWDQAWYMETSQDLYHVLTRDGLAAFLWQIQFALGGIKAPLLSILAIPMYLLFGNTEFSAMMVNTAFMFVSTLYLYKLCLLLFKSARLGFLAVLIFHTLPFSYALSRQFFVEYGLTTITIMFIFYLVKSDLFRHPRSNTMLGIILGIGLLMKINFPMYIAGPFLLVLIRRLKMSSYRIDRQLLMVMLKISALSIAIASVWYARNMATILKFAFSAGFGSLGAAYGTSDIFAPGPIKDYYGLVITEVLSPWYTVLFLVAFTTLIIASLFPKSRVRAQGSMAILSVWLIVPLFIITFGTNKDLRYITPLLSPLAITVAMFFNELFKRNHIFLIASLTIVVYPLYHMVDISFRSNNRNMLGYFAHPPNTRYWPLNEVIDYVYKNTLTDTANLRYNLLAVEHSTINANTFSFLASEKNYTTPFYFTSLGYREQDVSKAIKRINEMKPLFIIFQEGIPDGELSGEDNRCNAFVLDSLEKQKIDHYTRDTLFEFPDGVRLTLYKRF